jgi:RNA polymerase sigma factor (sigma-70 family)
LRFRRGAPYCARMRAFLDAHAAFILRVARGLVRDQGGAVGADDLAQQVIVSLLQMYGAGTFEPARVENPEAYLRVVVRNAAQRIWRRRKVTERTGDDGDVAEAAEDAARFDAEPAPSPEEVTLRAREARRILEGLKSRLRPRDALVLALLVEEGLEIDEVAARLGTSLNNVYQMRHRILVAAREVLGKDAMRDGLDSSRGVL